MSHKAVKDRSTSAWLVAFVLAGILLSVLRLADEDRGEVAKLRQQIESLRTAQQAIRDDVSDALRRQNVATASTVLQRDVVLDTRGAPWQGETNAPVTLIAFGDFESADCGRFSRETLPQLERDYISAGKLKYVFRSYPEESHSHALSAQEAASCAGEQGKFWQMHDRLFAARARLNPGDMPSHAQALGLDRQQFLTCFDAGLPMPAIRRDILEGQKSGVSSVPTFFLGPTVPSRASVRATKIIKGAPPYSELRDAIDALLVGS